MDNEQILEKAIKKAIDNGWDVFGTVNHQIDVEMITREMLEDDDHYFNDAPHPGLTVYIRRNGYYSSSEVIFNHDFTKALWGDGINLVAYDENGERLTLPEWQYHLQQMVISDDPIKYLGENI